MRRFKVWTIDPDGEPGTLLLRTGVAQPSDPTSFDVVHFNGTAVEAAELAQIRTGVTGWVQVKDFDTGEWTIVGLPGARQGH